MIALPSETADKLLVMSILCSRSIFLFSNFIRIQLRTLKRPFGTPSRCFHNRIVPFVVSHSLLAFYGRSKMILFQRNIIQYRVQNMYLHSKNGIQKKINILLKFRILEARILQRSVGLSSIFALAFLLFGIFFYNFFR